MSERKPVKPRRTRAASLEHELSAARARIAELESDLSGAQRTISALLDKAERRGNDEPAGASPEDRRGPSEQARAGEGDLEQSGVAQAGLDQPDVGQSGIEPPGEQPGVDQPSLDQIVRQRTRALAESEAQLRRKNAELERLNDMKAEFISIAAHELRTPLTSIVGYLDLMMEGKFGTLDGEMQRPMTSLRRNAHRLKRLVDEMLDVSRIEAGRIALRRIPCQLGNIARDVVAELTPLANAKSQQLVAEVAETPRIDADPDKIHQVVANLVANAIRYTPERGRITVLVDEAPQDRFAGAWARLRVRDNGVGIPAHLRNRIFEPFSGMHPAKHHTSSGPDSAGLGLYIARGLIDLHGGLITVESEEGAYTEFTVLLPLAE